MNWVYSMKRQKPAILECFAISMMKDTTPIIGVLYSIGYRVILEHIGASRCQDWSRILYKSWLMRVDINGR
jgi:hypothetical protein